MMVLFFFPLTAIAIYETQLDQYEDQMDVYGFKRRQQAKGSPLEGGDTFVTSDDEPFGRGLAISRSEKQSRLSHAQAPHLCPPGESEKDRGRAHSFSFM